ncbi:MAG: excinuclease ABC subunit UvrA [Reinekea sp.]
MDKISVQGARTHNLKNISIDIPRDKLVVITGLSGSGKSSLAFDTLYAEGQRRYVESLSTYARQFLSMMEKPDVDHIEGLSPAISIEQKTTSHNPRSTVGTTTEIYDYLRLLFARVGEPRCPEHGEPLEAQTISQMVDQVIALPEGSKLMLLAPLIRDRKGEHLHIFSELKAQGFVRVRVDGLVMDLDEVPALDKRKKHTIEAVVDRFKVRADLELRMAESFETCLTLSGGIAQVTWMDCDGEDMLFSNRFACPVCGYSIAELEPRMFSFNNPAGACEECDGLGLKQYFDRSKIIRDANLTLAEGAIAGWDRRSVYYFSQLTSMADHYGVDIEKPFNKLPKKFQKAVLEGSGSEEFEFNYVNSRGAIYHRVHTFEGVVPNMERRFRETDSNSVREELTKYLAEQPCPSCHGSRLKESARHVYVNNVTLPEVTRMSIVDAVRYYHSLQLTGNKAQIAEKILREIIQRLSFLENVGLDYLTLDRSADTLSGGETQRIRLASQIGAGLVGVMYILDEPSIGLHQRDNDRLLKTLTDLRDLGNTVLVVEHDEEAIRMADWVMDIGPGAGVHGGEVIASGPPEKIMANKNSLTGKYLTGELKIEVPTERAVNNPDRQLVVRGASGNNLRNVDLSIPVGLFSCITGVSGSGKSTLINRTLYPLAATELNNATTLSAAPHKAIEGLTHFDKVVDIDQSPIGRTPRSNPATYTGIFTAVRDLFAGTQEARSRGYSPGRFFEAIPALQRKLQTLTDVGLSYVKLGQSATTLSGGEAQRVKLARELSKRDTGNTLYILDEPTTGLHFHDIKQLLEVLHRLRDNGNTVVVIEHNLDVVKTADWIIDLGPEGGVKGGKIVSTGTPEQVAVDKKSVTGKYLHPLLVRGQQ